MKVTKLSYDSYGVYMLSHLSHVLLFTTLWIVAY